MKRALHLLSLMMLSLMTWNAAMAQAAELPRKSPESQGVASAEVLSLIDAVDKEVDSLNSIMVLRHGQVIAEGWWAPYHPEARHSLYSLSKSFTSTAVGLAIAEGKLSLDDPVLSFFPDEAPSEPSNHLKSMRVSDLLRMATGHQTEPPRTIDASWVKTFLAHPVPFKPGTHFLYNTSATYMQSAIVQKVTGTKVLDYLQPRLFEPLGIEQPTWESSPQGISTGGYGLSIRTEDIARFGQLYLQKGKWQGQQLVPESWVQEATARQVANGSNPLSDWDQGYGYQFWRCRHGAYRGDGAFGQYCIVLPEQETVIAITSGLKDMQSVMNLIWDKLLPALKSSPLTENAEAHAALEKKLKSLSLRPQGGNATAAKVLQQKFDFPVNEHQLKSVTLEASDQAGGIQLVMQYEGNQYRIHCRPDEWGRGEAGSGSLARQPVAASGGWSDDETFTCKVCFYETPFVVTSTFSFKGNELLYRSQSNVGFGPKGDFQLVGTDAAK